MKEQKTFVKWQRKPFKVYNRQLSPKEGIEILYLGGDETALINPNGFPWFNIKLDPLGSRMTKDQHHTIFDSGFDCFASILEGLFHKYDDRIDQMTNIGNSEMKHGKKCWVLNFENQYFKYIDYTVKENETVRSIAIKLKLCSEMIRRLNPTIESNDDIAKGQVIKIPNDYSPKMTLYIDKQSITPVMIQVYDEKGLYQQYEFIDVIINPGFSQDEFTSNFAEYDF